MLYSSSLQVRYGSVLALLEIFCTRAANFGKEKFYEAKTPPKDRAPQ